MKKYGLLGRKLTHSFSKVLHEILFKMEEIEASYDLLECEENDLPAYIEALRRKEYEGFNVTIPYKKIIINYLDGLTETAKRIGSVNTIYLEDDKVIGTNTDYDGFLETLHYFNVEVKEKKCYILGTGGAALTVRRVIEDQGGVPIFVSRKPDANSIGYQELQDQMIEILINTTPVGMYPNIEDCPVSKEVITKAKVVIDIIFNPLQTKLLQEASSHMNGLYMLVGQAVKAEMIWQGKKISCNTDDIIKKLEMMV